MVILIGEQGAVVDVNNQVLVGSGTFLLLNRALVNNCGFFAGTESRWLPVVVAIYILVVKSGSSERAFEVVVTLSGASLRQPRRF